MARHPSLHLLTSSGLFGGASPKSESPRTGLWTPTSPASAVSDDEDEVPVEVGGVVSRRKRAVGLWRSWAGDQNPPASNVNRERSFSGS